MYHVTVKAETVEELKVKVKKIHEALNGGKVFISAAPEEDTPVSESEDDDEMEDVPSPYTATPSVTPVTTPHVIDNGERDSEGLPWDDRIHASSRAKVKDGTWRTKRNLDENILFQVRAELKAKYGSAPVAQETASHIIPFTPTKPVAQPVVTPTPAPVVQAAPALPPQQPVMQSGHTLDTFKANFPMVLAALINEGKINQEWVNGTKSHYGVAEVWQLNDEQKAEVFNLFVEHGLVQRVG